MAWTWLAGLIGVLAGFLTHDKIMAKLATRRGLTRVVSHRPSRTGPRRKPAAGAEESREA
jgi:hypothetical protein